MTLSNKHYVLSQKGRITIYLIVRIDSVKSVESLNLI